MFYVRKLVSGVVDLDVGGIVGGGGFVDLDVGVGVENDGCVEVLCGVGVEFMLGVVIVVIGVGGGFVFVGGGVVENE